MSATSSCDIDIYADAEQMPQNLAKVWCWEAGGTGARLRMNLATGRLTGENCQWDSPAGFTIRGDLGVGIRRFQVRVQRARADGVREAPGSWGAAGAVHHADRNRSLDDDLVGIGSLARHLLPVLPRVSTRD